MSDLPPIVERMRDIQLPAEPGWWPPAPGWWGVSALVLFALLLALWLWRYRFALRREALRELARIEAQFRRHKDARLLAARLSTLLRRVALALDGRRPVARLHGEAWLAYLDRRGGEGAFTSGPGRALARFPYSGVVEEGGAEPDPKALLQLVRRWIRRNG